MNPESSFGFRAAGGFTLIEVMITVAIVALLASIAYPAYTDAVLKRKRAEGRTALTSLMQQQERYLTQSGSYMSFGVGATGNQGTTKAGSGVNIGFNSWSGDSGDVSRAAYKLGAVTCPETPALNECVMLIAQPTSRDPEVGTLRMRSTGAKDCVISPSNSSPPTKPSACW